MTLNFSYIYMNKDKLVKECQSDMVFIERLKKLKENKKEKKELELLVISEYFQIYNQNMTHIFKLKGARKEEEINELTKSKIKI